MRVCLGYGPMQQIPAGVQVTGGVSCSTSATFDQLVASARPLGDDLGPTCVACGHGTWRAAGRGEKLLPHARRPAFYNAIAKIPMIKVKAINYKR